MNHLSVKPYKLKWLMQWRNWLILFIILFFSLLLFSPYTSESIQAVGPYTVNTTTDTVDNNPGDGICADSGGLCSLRAAIQEANATAGDDFITLGAGTYTLSISGSGDDSSISGDLDIDRADTLTLTGAGQSLTTIDASGLSDRVFHLIQGDVEISDLAIVNGNVFWQWGRHSPKCQHILNANKHIRR